MAQFRGTLDGSRGPASRLGTKNSGLQVTANGWHLGCSAYLTYDEEADTDRITIYLTGGSSGGESPDILFSGTVEDVRQRLTGKRKTA